MIACGRRHHLGDCVDLHKRDELVEAGETDAQADQR